MDATRYVARQLDGVIFELLPSGDLLIWEKDDPHAPRIVRSATVYALYLFLYQPGIRPALRALDDERQRQAWEARQTM
jgi:hypothetical protein